MTAEKTIIIGYHPLLYANDLVGKMFKNEQAESVINRLEKLEEIKCSGILWALENDTIKPIVICNKAKQVAEHFRYYSESKPASWFKLYCQEINGSFVLVLMPDINKAVQRHAKACKITGHSVNLSEITYVFKPILVLIEKMSENCKAFMAQKLEHVDVSLVDVLQTKKAITNKTPIFELDRFQVCDDGWYDVKYFATQYINYQS